MGRRKDNDIDTQKTWDQLDWFSLMEKSQHLGSSEYLLYIAEHKVGDCIHVDTEAGLLQLMKEAGLANLDRNSLYRRAVFRT